MGAPGRPSRRLGAALAAVLLLAPAAALAPQAAQAQSGCASLPTPVVSVTGGVRSLTVTWAALPQNQGSVGSWHLRYRKTGASEWTVTTISDAAARSRTITGLDAGAAYQVRLSARHSNTRCPPSGLSTVATGTPAAAVAQSTAPVLSATAGAGQVTLSWTADTVLFPPNVGTSFQRWEYQRKSGAGAFGDWTAMGTVRATMTHTVTGLANNTAYTFRMRSSWTGSGGGGKGPASNEVTATPMAPVTTPGKTITLSADTATVTEGDAGMKDVVVTATLGEAAPAGGLVVTVNTASGATATGLSTCDQGSLGSKTDFCYDNYRVTIAAGRTTATLTVRVVGDTRDESNEIILLSGSASGDWASGNLLSITIVDDDGPGVTVSKSALAVAEGSTGTYTVKLDTAPSGDVTVTPASGDAAKATVSGALTFTATNWAAAQTVTVTGVARGTTAVSHTVAGYTGVSAAGSVVVTVTANAPPPARPARPANFAAAPGDGQVTLSWDDPDDGSITGYGLRHARTGARGGAVWAAIPGSGAGTTTHTVTGLENGAGYSFKVRAVNAAGAGTATAWAVAAPTDGVPKPALTATAGDGRVTLSWPARPGMLGWGWQVRGGAWSDWSVTRTAPGAGTGTVVGLQANGVALENGTEYTFRLFGLAPGGKQSVWSDWATATPVRGTRGVTVTPTALAVDEGGAGTYTVVLDATPSGPVTVTVGGASGDVTALPASLAFTASDWRRARTVTVRAARDEDTDTDADVTLAHGASGGGYGSVSVASVVVSVADTTPTLQLPADPADVTEGTAVGLTVTSDRAVAGTLPVRLALADRGSGGFAEADVAGGLGPRTLDAAFGGGTVATVSIPTVRDFDTGEGPEAYRITLVDAAGYAVGADATADGTLVDGPAPPRGGGGSPNRPPVADAGADFGAAPGAVAVLDGSGSSDPDGDRLAHLWRQVSGPDVTIVDARSARASFRAPEVPGTLVFRLRVTEPVGRRDTDDVRVTVGDEAPVFAAPAPALDLVAGEAMAAVVLPGATGGNGALAHTLSSAPAGLAGLAFDPATRRLTGTPPAEGSWTFTLRADDSDANRTAADAAVLTFPVTVADARTALVRRTVRRALAAVARRALAGALDSIGARLAAGMPPDGLALAGRSGAPAADPVRACATGAPLRRGPGAAGCGLAGRTVGPDELLRGSALSLALGAGGPGHGPHSPRWAVWGRGDHGTFSGRPDGMRYDGELRAGWLGVDARAGGWVAGLAVGHGTGGADYGLDGGGEGRLETRLTALHPYGRWTVSEGLELRGALGVGRGEARHRTDGGAWETAGLTMRMASLGLRHELPPAAGVDLAARADAGAARMETDGGPAPVHGLTADSWRLRAGMEASRRLALDGGASLTPFVEAAARRDGGDGLAGTGLEVAGGLRWEAPRVHVEARGRWLAAHTEDGAGERGVGVTARVGPGAHGRGLSLLLHPRWGADAGGAEALWRDGIPAAPPPAADGGAALDARLGYGLGLSPFGLLTPFAEAGLAGDSRRLRLGTRFGARHADMDVELSGERRGGGAGGAERAVRLDLRLRF